MEARGPDANLDNAILGTASAIFYNMGQCCTAGSRLFAHKKVFDQVVDGLVGEAGKLKIGHGLDPTTTLGPLVSEEQHKKVQGYLESGRGEGAEVVVGGEVAGNRGSGWGREMGKEVMEHYTETKAVGARLV